MIRVDNPKEAVAFKKGDLAVISTEDSSVYPRVWKYGMSLYEVERYMEDCYGEFETIMVMSVNNGVARAFLYEQGKGWGMV
ncbi:hypothetical protein [Veillonella seminalis]|uniref:Uncharacterized protein n=1 Tax=Veillonella seminalis ACS-216-V-Col6b TaxID=883156 RepID=K9D694_9FIRM|nr:hypothetical protein [Veillonella seminalis]EKU78736.1 hypothetical protein HMPREF9282_00533 [Veillonella seminalis ACS-216-V-Col6b]